ncbi:MAG TPA: thioesterase family protein [Solirubrobacteraceae bacterium]|jgi:acyl-CoA thioester hydrolase
MSEEFRHRLRVRYGECDPQGVVYFARYPEYVDIGMTALWRERIRPYNEMVEAGSDMVVAELTLRYRGSALFDDEIDVVIAVERLGETSLTCACRIERDGDVLVEGSIRQVCIDPATKAKKPLPADVRAALA